MLAGQVQHHWQVRQHLGHAALHRKVHLPAHCLDSGGLQLCIVVETVGDDRASNINQNVPHRLAVCTHHGSAIKRHAVQEVYECLFEVAKVVTVGLHMVCVNVGDHRQNGQ